MTQGNQPTVPAQEIVTTVSAQLIWSHDAEVVELVDLEPDNIHIGEYWLKLPPKEVLQAKLHKAMVEARARLELHSGGDGDE
jgi:hypothetical protein